MKVIHVVLGKANPERMNGVNKVVHHLASQQSKLGADVEVWGITKNPAGETPARRYRLRLFERLRVRVIPRRELSDALRTLTRSDLVHFHGSFILEFAVIGRMLQRRGIPYFLTSHGALNAQALRRNAWIKRLYFELVESSLLRGACGVQLVGKSEMECATRRLPEVRWCLIPNGEDVGPRHPSEESSPSVRTAFGFCGRMSWREKGVDILVRGYSEYVARGGCRPLWLIGDGPDLEKTRGLARSLGVDSSIVWWGARYGDERRDLIQRLVAFFHPSRHEGFPMGVLEAAALSCYLVVSEATNAGEYVQRFSAGQVLSENSPRAVAESMRAIDAMSEHEQAVLAANARRLVETELSWERIAAQLLSTYNGKAI